MGLAFFSVYFVIVGIINSIFLLLVIWRKRNGCYIHSITTRVIGSVLSAIAISPVVLIIGMIFN